MNVNVSYNGFSLADAASCVMMRLPVPNLVWDMEALWKVWNEPIPAITPEAVSEPLPEVPAVKSKKPVGRHRAVTYAGKEYPDVKSLAEAYHLNYKTCFARLRDGLPLDAPINRQMSSRAKPVTYNGVTYPSLTACAKTFGLTVSACSRRLQKGQPLDKKLKAGGRPLVPVTVNGAEYPSMAAAAKALGVPYQTLCSRIRKGQDLSAPKYADRCEPITYQGKEYPSVEALSRATGISSSSWLYRLKRGIPLDAPWGKGGNKQEKPAAPEPEAAEPAPEQKPASSPQKFRLEHSTCRQRLAAGLPLEESEKLEGDLAGMRQIKTTPASDLKAYRMRFRACRYGGKKYTSLSSLADLADCTIGQAYKAVMASGKWIREDEI